MNNILIDLLPKKVTVNDVEYDINSNFRTSILFALLIDDNEVNEEQKIVQSLELYYPILSINKKELKEKQKKLLENYKEAFEKIMWFYRCGKENKSFYKSQNKSNKELLKLYDFEQDANYIFSSFYTQYKLDLQEIEYLHWWKFMSLFNSLKDDTKLSEVIKYRSIKLSDIKDKDDRKFYKEMKKIYSLDEELNKEEVEELEKEKEEWK